MPFEMAKGHAMTVVDAELGMDQKFLEFVFPQEKWQYPTWNNNLVGLKASGLLKSYCYADSPGDIPH
jgi:hypothetical protein